MEIGWRGERESVCTSENFTMIEKREKGGDVEGKVVSASHFDRVLFQYSFTFLFLTFYSPLSPKFRASDSKTNGIAFKHKENEMMLKFHPSFQNFLSL